MIPAGRSVVTREGIAELHGLSWRQARRARPWAAEGHPEPLTRGRPTHSRPQLWDREQAAAFAGGAPVPALPVDPHAEDLLDRSEAAELAGVDPVAWERDIYRERVPEPDRTLHGGRYWYRATVQAWRAAHTVRQVGGGRPPGRADTVQRAQLPHRVRDLLEQEPDIRIAEVARRLGVHYATAHRHVSRIRTGSEPPDAAKQGD